MGKPVEAINGLVKLFEPIHSVFSSAFAVRPGCESGTRVASGNVGNGPTGCVYVHRGSRTVAHQVNVPAIGQRSERHISRRGTGGADGNAYIGARVSVTISKIGRAHV